MIKLHPLPQPRQGSGISQWDPQFYRSSHGNLNPCASLKEMGQITNKNILEIQPHSFRGWVFPANHVSTHSVIFLMAAKMLWNPNASLEHHMLLATKWWLVNPKWSCFMLFMIWLWFFMLFYINCQTLQSTSGRLQSKRGCEFWKSGKPTKKWKGAIFSG